MLAHDDTFKLALFGQGTYSRLHRNPYTYIYISILYLEYARVTFRNLGKSV